MIGVRGFFNGRKLLNISLVPEEGRPEIRSAEFKIFNVLLEEISKGA
jgi:hypothetical protein